MTIGSEALDSIHWREAIDSGDTSRLMTARRRVEEQIRANPADFEPLDVEVQILHALGEDALAERLLDEYLLYDPAASLASVRLAWLRHATGKRDEALAEVLATLGRDPACVEARVLAMNWLIEEGQASRAEQLGCEVTDPPARVLRWLGLAQAAMGNTEGAVATLRTAHAQEPGNEEIARDASRLLLSLRRPTDAFALIEPFARAEQASPRTWLVAARAAHGARLQRKGDWFLHRLATDPRCDQDVLQHDVMQVAAECLGGSSAETWALSLVESGEGLDSLGVELLESVGAQSNRGKVERVFAAAGRLPQRYPRTLARFFTTFHELTTTYGVVQRWVDTNGAAIQSHTPIWAGVGAWLLHRRKYQEAADHLVHWPGRRQVRPWMILLLGRALEALGRHPEANAQYRAGLQLPPDHSEPGLRTRLAFNMALDGLAANGHLVLVEMSPRGGQYVTVEDRARSTAVEALFAIDGSSGPEEGREHLSEALGLLADLRGRDHSGTVTQIERLFVRRVEEIIDDPRTYGRDR